MNSARVEKADGAENYSTQEKVGILADFLNLKGVPSGKVMVHGSFALELLGLINGPAQDIDLVCSDDRVFDKICERSLVDPHSCDKVTFNHNGIQIEIFRSWNPLKKRPAIDAELSNNSTVFFLPSIRGEYYVLIPHILQILLYKVARIEARHHKSHRDEEHLSYLLSPGNRQLLLYMLANRSLDASVMKEALNVIVDFERQLHYVHSD